MVTLSIKNLTAGEILAIKRDEMRGVIPRAGKKGVGLPGSFNVTLSMRGFPAVKGAN